MKHKMKNNRYSNPRISNPRILQKFSSPEPNRYSTIASKSTTRNDLYNVNMHEYIRGSHVLENMHSYFR